MLNVNWRNASVAQLKVWDYVSNLIVWNTLTPIVYTGPIAGCEFLNYSATKLYLGLEYKTNMTATGTAPAGIVSFYNEANVLMLTSYFSSVISSSAFWFSRVTFTAVVYTHFFFNGYRLEQI